MLSRNTKVKVRSLDGAIDYFDIVAGVLQGDIIPILLYHLSRLRAYHLYRLRAVDKMKENGFKLTKERSRRYPAHTIMDADYADDIVLLANTPA